MSVAAIATCAIAIVATTRFATRRRAVAILIKMILQLARALSGRPGGIASRRLGIQEIMGVFEIVVDVLRIGVVQDVELRADHELGKAARNVTVGRLSIRLLIREQVHDLRGVVIVAAAHN